MQKKDKGELVLKFCIERAVDIFDNREIFKYCPIIMSSIISQFLKNRSYGKFDATRYNMHTSNEITNK